MWREWTSNLFWNWSGIPFVTLPGLLHLTFVWFSTQAKEIYKILCVTTVPQLYVNSGFIEFVLVI